MKRQHEAAVATLAPPRPDWILVCKRRFTMAGLLYSVGALVDLTAFAASRNWNHLLINRYVAWQPESDQKRPQPVPIAPSLPPAQRPIVIVVAHDDPLIALGLSYSATAKAAGNNFGLARDLIEGDRDAGRLFQAAARIYAVRRGESFRRSVEGLWETSLRLAAAA